MSNNCPVKRVFLTCRTAAPGPSYLMSGRHHDVLFKHASVNHSSVVQHSYRYLQITCTKWRSQTLLFYFGPAMKLPWHKRLRFLSKQKAPSQRICATTYVFLSIFILVSCSQ